MLLALYRSLASWSLFAAKFGTFDCIAAHWLPSCFVLDSVSSRAITSFIVAAWPGLATTTRFVAAGAAATAAVG